jgi:hypothetical protein
VISIREKLDHRPYFLIGLAKEGVAQETKRIVKSLSVAFR